MAITQGTVNKIKIRQTPDSDVELDVAIIEVLDANNQMNTLILWDALTTDQTDFSNWIARTMNLSLLRVALVNKLQVSILHGNTSAFIDWVQLISA
jgi:hypothetical protein